MQITTKIKSCFLVIVGNIHHISERVFFERKNEAFWVPYFTVPVIVIVVNILKFVCTKVK